MNNHELFEAIGDADEELLARAETSRGGIRRAFFGKPLKVALLAAALAGLLSFTAFAVYRFVLPKTLEDTLNLASPQIYTVIDTASASADTLFIENKTVHTGGYAVTFEAVARGTCMNDIYKNGEPLRPEKTYAVFSVKKEDGTDVGSSELCLGYCVSLKGYAPNPSMFPAELLSQTENGVVYAACDVTSALPFANRELTVSLADRHVVTPEILRMDENGNAYFTESYHGLAAQFTLRLPADAADNAKQERYMIDNPCFDPDPDYGAFEALDARREAIASGEVDYSAYIGDNEWQPYYKMEIGQVYCADTYLEKRGAWARPDAHPLTIEALNAVISRKENEIYEQTLANGLSDEEAEKLEAAATVSEGDFPAQADRFTLPDGSVCFCLPGNNFLRIRPDGIPCFIAADCKSVIVETVGLGSSPMTSHTAPAVDRGGVVMAQLLGCYIDNRSPLEAQHDEVSDESLMLIYESSFVDIACREDAIASLLSRYAIYDGTAEIR